MAQGLFNKILGKVRTQFIAGLLVIVPLVLTAVIIIFLFDKLDDILAPILYKYLGEYYIKGLGLILLLFSIWFIGLLTRNFFGKQVVALYEFVIRNTPIINTIFGGIKQISDNLLSTKSKSFKQVVMVRFPFYGVHAIGFLTSSICGTIK